MISLTRKSGFQASLKLQPSGGSVGWEACWDLITKGSDAASRESQSLRCAGEPCHVRHRSRMDQLEVGPADRWAPEANFN